MSHRFIAQLKIFLQMIRFEEMPIEMLAQRSWKNGVIDLPYHRDKILIFFFIENKKGRKRGLTVELLL